MSQRVRSWLRDNTQNFKSWSGPETSFNCPYCEDKGSHLFFNVEAGVGHCFKCGTKCNLVAIIRKVEGVTSHRAGLRAVELGYVPLAPDEYKHEDEHVPLPKVDLPSTTMGFWVKKTSDIREYMKVRGFDTDDPRYHQLAMERYETEWGPSVLFPCRDMGALRGWQERFVHPNTKNVRYMTSKGLPCAKLFLGPPTLKPKLPPELIVTEGPFDMLSVVRAGLQQVVCTFGKKLSSVHCQRMYWSEVQRVTVFYDQDATPNSVQASRQLCSYVPEVRMVVYDDNQRSFDPGGMSPDLILHHIRTAVEMTAWEGFDHVLRTGLAKVRP